MTYGVDKVKDRDIYLDRVQNEGQEREDDDDDVSSGSSFTSAHSAFANRFRMKATTKKKMKIFKVMKKKTMHSSTTVTPRFIRRMTRMQREATRVHRHRKSARNPRHPRPCPRRSPAKRRRRLNPRNHRRRKRPRAKRRSKMILIEPLEIIQTHRCVNISSANLSLFFLFQSTNVH